MEVCLFLFGTFIGIPVFYGIYGAFTYIVESCYGRKIHSFKYLIFSYTESMGLHICNFSPICEITMRKENDTEKEITTAFIIKMVIQYVIGIAIVIFALIMYKFNIFPLWLASFMAGISAWFGIDMISRSFFIAMALKNESKPLNKNYREILKKMLDGVPFGEIEVPDYRTYEQKSDKTTIAKYQHLFFMNRVWHDDKKSIDYAVQSMELCIGMDYLSNEKAYLQNMTDIYYDLLFYYSFIDTNKYRAEKIFKIISPDLLADHDSNGYRTLAYYNYFILENELSTEMCIRKGLELIDEFPIISQREYEKMLLLNLLKAFPDSLTYTHFFRNS